ncbi:MAG: GGDEF domain-containing protein [Hyphomicrobiaceae bacterium]
MISLTDTPWLSNDNPSLFLSRARQNLEVALQPIVDMHTGRVVAYESLVREVGRLGFSSIAQLFDHAHQIGSLAELELEIQAKAVRKFANLDRAPDSLLFLNLDGRLARSSSVRTGLGAIIERSFLRPSEICIEISEANQEVAARDFESLTTALRAEGFRVAIDDYGTGYSGLQMLYQANPDFLKIDRFFVRALEGDGKKRLLVASVVDLAHTLGVAVIAEGIETPEELACCRGIRCDFAQGYLISPPVQITSELALSYAGVATSSPRRETAEADTLRQCLAPVQTLPESARLADAMRVFETHSRQSVVPILSANGMPVGIVREHDIKPFLYSPFGRELLQNRSSGFTLAQFIRPVPIANVNSQIGRIIETYHDRLADGILITEELRYVGYLSPLAIARIVSDLRVAEARGANPLTRLPGNEAVHSFMANACAQATHERVFCYFDFDNFKPFNDAYGFRVGDRAILIFGDLLRALKGTSSVFIGHVGGDDFFAGAAGPDAEILSNGLGELQRKFSEAVHSLYEREDRERGFLTGVGRDGQKAAFPLMTCSAAIIHLPAGASDVDVEGVTRRFAGLKKQAKLSPARFAIETVAPVGALTIDRRPGAARAILGH